ncbi:hypothetical protein FS935_18635 [Metabacillus litoralis]|uniref:Uncharacterized protein n=1 Tax=Metabacillus litoralis TaxID=152268 RepID=A0A5C6VKZ2_9BACI|nr:hypothetical protein [Metabacillus litoralis]TXC86063.1 hypothetical protein FS935_18635 [Metabacillus litoralis]
MFNKENKMAVALSIIGWVEIVIGIFCGLTFSSVHDGYEEVFLLSTFIMWASAGIISGVFFLGLAEVVELLHHIRNNLSESKNKTQIVDEPIKSTEISQRGTINSESSNSTPTKENWSITEQQKDAINALYSNKLDKVVIPSPYKNFCIVDFGGNKIEIIEIKQNGFPFILADFYWKEIQNEIHQWYKEYKNNHN